MKTIKTANLIDHYLQSSAITNYARVTLSNDVEANNNGSPNRPLPAVSYNTPVRESNDVKSNPTHDSVTHVCRQRNHLVANVCY